VAAKAKVLKLGAFNITAIPGNSVIDGIEVTVEGHTDLRQAKVAVSWNGRNWSTAKNTNLPVGSSDAVTTLGGSSDTWGPHVWLAQDFTNLNFFVRLTSAGNKQSGTLYVDHVQVKIYYSPPNTTLTVAPVNAIYGTDTSVDLSATLTQTVGGAALAGKSITFQLNGVPVGSPVTTSGAGVATLSGVDISTLGAGLYPNAIRADFAGDVSYDATYGLGDLDIWSTDQATVTADPQAKMYGQADPTLTHQVAGLDVGDSCVVVLSRELGEELGDYEIFADSIDCPPQYYVTYVADFLTINPFEATLTITNSPLRYIGTPQSAVINSDIAGTISNVLYDGSAVAPTAIGTYAVTADFTPTDTTYCGGPDPTINCATLTGASAGDFVITQTSIFRSTGGYDGWILESSETSRKGGSKNSTQATLRVGDNAADRQYRSILSFNTAGLPDDAVILGIRLLLTPAGGVNATDIFSELLSLRVDIKRPFYGTLRSLQPADFQSPPLTTGKNAVGQVRPVLVGGRRVARLRSIAFPYLNDAGTTQLRLRFVLDDNDDNLANYLLLYSGDAGIARRPRLVITYSLP